MSPALSDPLIAPAPPPVLEFDGVCLAFGSQQVLRGVDLCALPRERLVILGRSGCGKSTLLRLALGILKPDAGRVRFTGREISALSRHELNLMRQRIGMVYQYSALISSLSVRENLALPLEELTHKTAGEIAQIVEEKLGLVGMLEAREKMPGELSGGMKKRVALARALVLEPELILFDEPTAGLDPVISAVIDDLIIELSEKTGATSLIVTHEMASAFKVATRMAMLCQGRILLESRPEQFRQSEEPLVREFIDGYLRGPSPG